MKICVYEVRDDEKELLKSCSASLGVKALLSEEVPSMETAEYAKGCDGVSVLGQGTLDRELLTAFKTMGVKYISTRTVGYDHIDVKAAQELGLHVCNAAYPADSVADFTIMLMLMCLRHYKQAMWRGRVNDFSLGGLQGRCLSSMTVGIIGTGNIGVRVMEELVGFGCKVLCYSRHRNPEAEKYGTYVELDELYRSCDIITLHMALTDKTRHMIDRDAIASMKDGVVLINCARGGLMDTEALVEGIETEKIGALGLDTIEGEDGIVHGDHRTEILVNRDIFYLQQFRNVVMTQHMAFYTHEAVENMAACGIEGIVRMEQDGTYRTMIV